LNALLEEETTEKALKEEIAKIFKRAKYPMEDSEINRVQLMEEEAKNLS
jgi:hypothetical protein